MSNYLHELYGVLQEVPVYSKPKKSRDGQRAINTILHGTWAGVVEERKNHYKVVTAGKDGWVRKEHLSDDMGLKMFFIDVGQGDGVLVEYGDKKMLIDCGPSSNVKNYLTQWQYSYLLDKNIKVHFDYVFITHFDADHYAGLIEILNDDRFSFGTIYHNGIARFKDKDKRPAEYNVDLGRTIGSRSKKYLVTHFDNISDLRALKVKGGFTATFNSFYVAVDNAIRSGRIGKIKMATYRSNNISIDSTSGKNLTIDFLGPVYEKNDNNSKVFKWFKDSSHTRNGHSLILKFKHENVSILLGGDLNTSSEEYLMEHYKDHNPFRVDVAKSCHHGSSDFSIDFMTLLSPYATVISSGDNESHAHPRAEAIGAAGKYSRGSLPKVYSTELARSVKRSGEILFGMINLRSNGDQIYMAQMKEAKKPDIWDSYEIIH